MTLKQQSELTDNILKERIDSLLPNLMKELDIQCWVITGREYNEDPVLHTFLPSFMQHVRRTMILIFLNIDGKYKKICLDPEQSVLNEYYECVWDRENETQYEAFGRILEEYSPANVALNTMSNIPLADGLTVQLLANIKPYIKTKTVSAEKMCVRWLESRLDKEVDVIRNIVEKTHEIINNSFSSEFVIPDKTTTDDIEWHMREQIVELNGVYWFGPDVDFQREGEVNSRQKGLIKKGDLLHCDIGIQYLGYNSDIQRLAYVLSESSDDSVDEMQGMLSLGNNLQDELTSEFIEGRTGNEILKKTFDKVRDKEYNSMMYTHPIGYHGHGVGPSIGKYDNQKHVPLIGELKLYNNTCYALELNISKKMSAWNNQLVYIYLEEDIIFKDNKTEYLNGRQENIIMIRS